MTTEVPATEAGREFLANLVGRFGGSAMDPISWDLTVQDVLRIEAEARAGSDDVAYAQGVKAGRREEAILKPQSKLYV